MGRNLDPYKKTIPCGGSCCDGPRPPHGKACCPDERYIVEKVIANEQENSCFSGLIEIKGLPGSLCPPLCLHGLEVLLVEPCIHSVCCAAAQDERSMLITLRCYVRDSGGCRAEGTASITVCTNCPQRLPPCGAQIRRGAQVSIRHCSFCAPCCFDVRLDLCISMLYSQCEIVSRRAACSELPCPALPLYPPPNQPHRDGWNEHFYR